MDALGSLFGSEGVVTKIGNIGGGLAKEFLGVGQVERASEAADNKARALRKQADFERKLSNFNLEQSARKATLQHGQIKANLAASGVRGSSGTSYEDLLAYNDVLTERLTAQMEKDNFNIENMLTQADYASDQADSLMAAAPYVAASKLVSLGLSAYLYKTDTFKGKE